MSEQEKSGGSGASVVLVEKATASRHKPYRPTELQEEASTDLHKRSRAPAVPSVAEDLKHSTPNEAGAVDHNECERSMSSEKHTNLGRKSSSKRRGSPAEEIAMVLMDTKKESSISTQPQPIPAHVDIDPTILKPTVKQHDEKKLDSDSITEDVAEMRTPEVVAAEHSEWSDDEEAGGLPRSESRGSRVSRAVRQFLCCGVAYQAPSEEDLSPREFTGI